MKVLLTGASRGIGKSILHKFLENGHEVYAPSRAELDLSKKVFLDRTDFDIIVNNAAINPLNDIPYASTEETMRVNYFSPLEIIQQCLPYMCNQQFGRIINIGSIWINLARAKRSAYASSKSALHSLTMSLTAEYSCKNILTNTVSPGFIGTDLTFSNNSKEELENIVKSIPVKRMGKVQEVADLVYFLSSKENGFICGQNLIIDGGYTCSLQF